MTQKRKKRELFHLFMILPCIVFLGAFGIYPFGLCVYTSLCDYSPMTGGRIFIGFGNFVDIFRDAWFWEALRTTIVFMVFTVSFEFLIGIVLALVLFQQFRGRTVIQILFIVPMMMTPVASAVVWKLIFYGQPNIGLVNFVLSLANRQPQRWFASNVQAFPLVVLLDIWKWSPFMALVLLAGLHALPKEPSEAAMIDGASGWQIFRHVTLPLLRPIFVFVVFFKMIFSLKAFDMIFSTTRGGPGRVTQTLNLYVFMQSFDYFEVGYGSALALILVFVTILILQPLYKSLRRG